MGVDGRPINRKQAMNRLTTMMTTAALALACHAAVAATLCVATQGKDANPGTEDRPFATLERARDEIRQRKASGPLPAGGIAAARTNWRGRSS
jgi:hypothetical protein